MDYVVLVLEQAFNKKKFAACDHRPIPIIKIGRNDDIGDAGFVFHRNKNKPLGRAWSLPGDDATSHAHKFSIAAGSQFLG